MCKHLEVIIVASLIFFIFLLSSVTVFQSRIPVFWSGKRTHSWGIGTKALPEWYIHLIYNQCNVYKHLEVIIVVSLILFYSLTYLRLGVSEQDFGRLGCKCTRSWSVSTKALPEWYKHLIYNQYNVYNHLEVIIEVSLILFYCSPNHRLRVSEQDFGCFGGKRACSWSISAKALSGWYKHLIYNQ